MLTLLFFLLLFQKYPNSPPFKKLADILIDHELRVPEISFLWSSLALFPLRFPEWLCLPTSSAVCCSLSAKSPLSALEQTKVVVWYGRSLNWKTWELVPALSRMPRRGLGQVTSLLEMPVHRAERAVGPIKPAAEPVS